MAGEGHSGLPPQGGTPGLYGCPLTNKERQPLLILHVDVENIMVSSFRYAKDAASAEAGDLTDVSARQLASHILAETVCGTIDPDSGEWKPVDELKQRLQSFGSDLKLRRKLQPARGAGLAADAEAAASALHNGHKALLRRMMLPPTVCLALGCETPDTNKVMRSGCTAGRLTQDGAEGAPPSALHEDQGSQTHEEGQLPQQLRNGFWRLTPSFLSLLFSLARSRRAFRLVLHTRRPLESPEMRELLYEFNLLCEGKHPAFDGENRTKQEIYVGIMYQKFNDSRAICISHQCVDPKQLLGAAVGGGDETQFSNTVKGNSATEPPDEGRPALAFENELSKRSQLELHATCPLFVWVDAQDLTHFHVCLSSSGIFTLINGVTYVPTLLPVDVDTQRSLVLDAGRWEISEEQTKLKRQILPSLQISASTSGSLDVGPVASKIASSQWDCLTNPDCLVAALTVCEERRLRLATAFHMHSGDQVEACKKAAIKNKEQLLSELPASDLGFAALHDILNKRACTEEEAGSSQPTDAAYLMKHVVPVLYPAIEETLRYRPENPLASIALYLLRNAGGYSRSSTRQTEGA
ncbi:hypothetical protein ACSSS7_006591 [Eimeria intestinalis]